jgi:Ca-activated chloride channel family protein
LLCVPPFLAFAAWSAWRRGRDGGWANVIDPALLSALRLPGAVGRGASPWGLLALIWTLAAFALAGPAWERERTPAFRASNDWFVLLDLSPSMMANDVAPERVTRARYAIEDLLQGAGDARIGLVVFAAEAHTVTPLTTDVATIRALLPPLAPTLMPAPGDKLGPAIAEVSQLMRATPSRTPQVVLFSDGVSDPAQALQALRALRRSGATLWVVGVGSDGRLPVDQLQQLATSGGGAFVPVTQTRQLAERLASLQVGATEREPEREVQVDTWRDGGVWLLPPLVLLVALMARRGWL